METAPDRFRGISEDLLKNGMDVRISTLGSSMYPLITTGDKITISPEKDPVSGDIIVYKSDDQMVCHRLVRVFDKDGVTYYQTRGDSFFGLDEPVTAKQILGKVINIERVNVSISRKLLLFIHPALRFGKLNAYVTSALIKIRSIFF